MDWVEEARLSRSSSGSGGGKPERGGGLVDDWVEEARLSRASGSRGAGSAASDGLVDDWVEEVRSSRASGAGGAGPEGSGGLGDASVEEAAGTDGFLEVDRRAPAAPSDRLDRARSEEHRQYAQPDEERVVRPAEPSGGNRGRGSVGQVGARSPRGRSSASSPPAKAVEDPVQQAKEICLRLLTARPRTRVELAQALTRKGVDPDVADQVLGRLDEVGLVDDAGFAEVWVRSRHTFQGLSRRALAVELRRKGVADEAAADALATVDSDAEEERARQLVRKRLRGLGDADEATKVRKLVGMLARKGYSEGLAYRVVKDEVRTSLLDDTF